MFNNEKIRDLEQKVNDLCKVVGDIDAPKYRRQIKEAVKYDVLHDLDWINACDKSIEYKVKEEVKRQKAKIQLNSMYGVFATKPKGNDFMCGRLDKILYVLEALTGKEWVWVRYDTAGNLYFRIEEEGKNTIIYLSVEMTY